jgi:hypothetical protein
MRSLISQVDIINESLTSGIIGTFKNYGLVKEIINNGKKQNFDYKTKGPVVIDDAYESFFYHKINGNITFEKLRSPGKTNLYNAKAQINLVCFSKSSGFEEHITNRLSNIRLLTILNTDNDSYKIIAEETEQKDFDFEKYLFVVSYQILYKTDNCHELCQ